MYLLIYLLFYLAVGDDLHWNWSTSAEWMSLRIVFHFFHWDFGASPNPYWNSPLVEAGYARGSATVRNVGSDLHRVSRILVRVLARPPVPFLTPVSVIWYQTRLGGMKHWHVHRRATTLYGPIILIGRGSHKVTIALAPPCCISTSHKLPQKQWIPCGSRWSPQTSTGDTDRSNGICSSSTINTVRIRVFPSSCTPPPPHTHTSRILGSYLTGID